jgi:paraquat-inducible protein A
MSENWVGCKVCGLVHEMEEVEPGYRAECARCGHSIRQRTPASLSLTFALALSALLLYFPANVFPILRMSMFGRLTENTIFTGVLRFYQDGDYFVAIVVFLASILIPFLKILTLLALVISTHLRSQRGQLFRTKLFVAIERLGPWAMLDVFALAVLISLIKIQRIANVIPGKGAAAFVLVVLFTILASASFDAQLIWNKEQTHD